MRRYVVTKPFRADVGGEEILLEAGEMIPGPRVPEVESWGRSLHHLINTHRLAPVDVVSDGDATDEQVVNQHGPALLTFYSDEALHAELKSRVEIPEGTRVFTAEDADELVEHGEVMVKKPSPVHLLKQDDPFVVETNEGTLFGEPGGYVAHDPLSGHVWPVSADYVDLHYQEPDALEATVIGDDVNAEKA
jgi:hypothetical protein